MACDINRYGHLRCLLGTSRLFMVKCVGSLFVPFDISLLVVLAFLAPVDV